MSAQPIQHVRKICEFALHTQSHRQVEILVSSPLGTDRVDRPLTIVEGTDLRLWTDKPRYQQGDIVHVRGLARDRYALAPRSGQPVRLDVLDPAGNRILHRALLASAFGVIEVNLDLAEDAAPGVYSLRAAGPTGTTLRRFSVERSRRAGARS